MLQIKRILHSLIVTPCRDAGDWLWRFLQSDERGGTTVMVALSVPIVVGALGVGVYTGAWYMEKHRVAVTPYSAAVNVGSDYFKKATNKNLSGS